VRRQIVVAVAAALALGGCQDAPKEAAKEAAPPRPLVVASFYPLYDFARQVAGDRAEAVSLVPAGVEPHDWEPSPRDVAMMSLELEALRDVHRSRRSYRARPANTACEGAWS
jgi:zinc transport system substrate-binding protein